MAMEKIKVAHHSKYIGYSGTDRTAQLFCKYLNQSDKFEPFLVYRQNVGNDERLDIMKNILGEEHVVPYNWVPGKRGQQPPYLPEQDNLYDVLKVIDPQIVHIHRGGWQEWPAFRYMAPKAKWVETNIFGFNDNSPEPQIDMHLYISDFIRTSALNAGNKDGIVLFNPIEQPVLNMTPDNKQLCREQLLQKYKLPPNAILLGRVGRADNFDPISLNAFKDVEKIHPEAYYLVVNPCDNWRNTAKQFNIQNIRFIDPIINDKELSMFYMGLDIYAHARSDGEACPCNIQEAMMHGIPVVSHESAIYNGQSEIIGDSGFVVPLGDWEAYRDILNGLIENPEMANEDETGLVRLRNYFARQARRRAMRHFEAECITKQLEKIYQTILTNAPSRIS
jgi:glycosyltransferase involved in cell wall biosynthesis